MINLADYLKLERPLAVLDLETTGVESETDRVCQIALTVFYPDKDPLWWTALINPERPILNHKIHGVTDDMVRDAKTFAHFAPQLAPRLMQMDIGGYNVQFDIKFLRAEFKRARLDWPWNNHVIDAYQVFRQQLPHTLSNAYLEFGGPGGTRTDKAFDNAHDAGADVAATAQVFAGQLMRYPNLPRTVAELSSVCFPRHPDAIDDKSLLIWVGDVVCLNFGKHARNGPIPLSRVPRDYFKFILGADFSETVKEHAADALNGKFRRRGDLT